MPGWVKKLDLVGLVVLLGVGIAYTLDPVWRTRMTVAAGVGAVLILVAVIARWGSIRAGLRRRSTRYGANSLTSVVLMIGVLGFINYLGVENDRRFDLTTSKLYSLSEQSVTVVDQLAEDVHILAFYPQGDDPAAKALLDLYTAGSSHIDYEFIDPDRQPQLAAENDVTVYGGFDNPLTGQQVRFGTMILEMEGVTERIEKESAVLEEDVTNALMTLIKGETKTIYFITGHGEKAIDDSDRAGLDVARGALERESYQVQSLNLAETEEVPEDAAALVWAGPQVEPFETEIDLVDAYLNHGGSVLVMVDPSPSASLSGLLDRWSVSAADDFVIDVSGLGQLFGAGPEIPLVSSYPTHAITRQFNLMTVFPLARSLSTAPDAEGLSVTELLRTSSRSWAETGTDTTAEFDPERDLQGPVTIGLAITKDLGVLASAEGEEGAEGESGTDEQTATARLAVVGDSDFATNTFFDVQGNGDLFLNMVSWLAEDEGFISIRPKQPDDRPLDLTLTERRIITYLSVALVPLGILGAGVSVWMKRRKR